jgi:hypothetical protein
LNSEIKEINAELAKMGGDPTYNKLQPGFMVKKNIPGEV